MCIISSVHCSNLPGILKQQHQLITLHACLHACPKHEDGRGPAAAQPHDACMQQCCDPGVLFWLLAVYLTADDVIAATRDTMEDTIVYINEKHDGIVHYLHEARVSGSPCLGPAS